MRIWVAAYLAALVTLLGLALAGGAVLYDNRGPSDAIEAAASGHEYSLTSWELRHFPGKWLYKMGGFLSGRSPGDPDADLRRYFELTERIGAQEQASASGGGAQDLTAERAQLENRAEDIIEGRITRLLEDQGLALRPPLFSDLGLVFPPVDFEFDSPPRVLAVSPRDRIHLDASFLLSPGLDLQTVTSIEQEAEAARLPRRYPHGVSALVVNTGGVATYPSVVSDLASYQSLIDTVIHEWLHQYLAFFPLGSSYFKDSETRTLNESVANLGGQALAGLYFQRYGTLSPIPTPAPVSPSPAGAQTGGRQPGFDFGQEMRALRVRVEELLNGGKTAEAEALMEQKRQEFAQHGVFIRRLNQAYFAFHGSYADTPASIDPIGPKLETLLQRAGSPGAFVRLAAGLSSAAELDALLAKLGL
ncbi:MAG: hypothetical protein Q7T33_12185 [Dehalococcoidia bacterium]|nr:hypothetical protein [Dehalococcoidia bacterium]